MNGLKARVLVTMKCNRSCDGCCNKHDIFKPEVLRGWDELLNYNEVMITGGEPVLAEEKVREVVAFLKSNNYAGKLYLYSALFDESFYNEFLDKFDGLHFTMHAEAVDNDIIGLKRLSEKIKRKKSKFTSRLAIDRRLLDRFIFVNIDFSVWSVVRWMEWKKECPLPEREKLFILEGA